MAVRKFFCSDVTVVTVVICVGYEDVKMFRNGGSFTEWKGELFTDRDPVLVAAVVCFGCEDWMIYVMVDSVASMTESEAWHFLDSVMVYIAGFRVVPRCPPSVSQRLI